MLHVRLSYVIKVLLTYLLTYQIRADPSPLHRRTGYAHLARVPTSRPGRGQAGRAGVCLPAARAPGCVGWRGPAGCMHVQ